MFDTYNLDQKFRLVYDAVSFFDGNNLQDIENLTEEGIAQYELWKEYYEDWREAHGESVELQGIVTEIDHEPLYTDEIKKISIENISYEFSSLKSNDDIVHFSKKYGMLGLLPDFHLGTHTLHRTHFEPFDIWHSEIKEFSKIMKLYRALSTNNDRTEDSIEGNVIKISDNLDFRGLFEIRWYDNTPTRKSFPEQVLQSMSMVDIGRIILSEKLEEYTKGIDLKINKIVKSEKNKIGFYITEKRETPYLITAIYYDLWDKINSNLQVSICANPKCKLPFMKIKRQKYCSNACKQESYRLRKEEEGGE
ncbi:hypothetical protein CON78_26100 [Bacillus toyonensis]|uniref:hypothetical protein n=1 Tax=Bacillus toyonensis TaxID=155322 RepID=UPI000BEC3BD3|nr:hypothetical protein [Bacillus toyonensis]MCG3795992.1 hypothetical protein [Bacillus toyonensis]PED97817.1 hypothetical protein CON78_26100 [Bacillus toyonensis]